MYSAFIESNIFYSLERGKKKKPTRYNLLFQIAYKSASETTNIDFVLEVHSESEVHWALLLKLYWGIET